MTDEKKKPEEDEVSDEQLEDIAGGVTELGQERLASPTTPDAPSAVYKPDGSLTSKSVGEKIIGQHTSAGKTLPVDD
jgi:hypothetical protein